MKNYSFLIVASLIFTTTAWAQLQEPEFLKPYNESKEKLKKLPAKPFEPTLFCSHMKAMIDLAPGADRQDLNLKPDRIVVSKSRKKLYLMSNRQLISTYDVAFGFGFLEGAKAQQADGRTPEGIYQIDFKNSKSNYTKALHVSYPEERDEKFAAANGVEPGGSIMIHGFPRKEIDGLDPVYIPQIHPNVNWTQGCMAVTNTEISEIFEMVDEGITVEICPGTEEAEVSETVAPLIEATTQSPSFEESLQLDLNPGGL